VRERARTVLDGAGHAETFAAHARELAEGVEVDGDARDRAVRKRDAAVAGASLYADLREALEVRADDLLEPFDVLGQLLNGAVVLTYLADFTTDGDRDPGGFELTDELRKARGDL